MRQRNISMLNLTDEDYQSLLVSLRVIRASLRMQSVGLYLCSDQTHAVFTTQGGVLTWVESGELWPLNEVVEKGQTLVLHDWSPEPTAIRHLFPGHPQPGGAHFLAAVPLLAEDGTTLGVCFLLDSNRPTWTQESDELLALHGEQLAQQLKIFRQLFVLQESEIRIAAWRMATQAVKMGVWAWDVTNNVLTWDRSLYDLYGVNAADFSGAYDAWEKTLHPEDREASVALLEQSLRTGQDLNMRFRILAGQSDVRHIAARGRVELDSSGKAKRIVGVNWDVTSEELFQQDLQFQNQELRATFSAMQEGLVIQNRDGSIEKFNPAALKILGLTADEILGRTSMDPRWRAVREDGSDFPGGEHPAMVALKTGREQRNVIMGVHHREGEQTWILINAQVIFRTQDPVPWQVVSTFADITALVESERKLEERSRELQLEKKKYEDLVYALNASAIVATTDPRGIITWANDKFCEVSGYALDELVGQNHRILRSGQHSPEFYRKLWQSISSGRIWQGEICNRRRDGSLYWVDSHILPIMDEQGKIRQYVAIRFDVTERKELEKQLVDLREAEKLANAAKSEFLANMSHELRTPLNGVLGVADLLLESKLDDEQHQYVEVISRSGRSLLLLINDILAFSKIEAKMVELEEVEFDLPQVLKDLVAPFILTAQRKGLKFVLNTDEAPSLVRGDSGRLQQVLLNLISNAIKFTRKGEVRLDAKVLAEQPDGFDVEFVVSDTGVGIPLAAQKRLFTPFTQAERSTSREFGGTGLGLAISRGLLDVMGGSIRFESGPQGTQFFVGLRLTKGAPQNQSSETATPAMADARVGILGGRILVAEDNTVNQMVASRLLANLGCKSLVVSTGEEVLQALRETPFDLILMDCQMPIMDGFEATRAVRAQSHEPWRNIPIVALTANAIKGDDEKCFAAGMNDYLTKPIRKDSLVEVLSKYLKQDTLASLGSLEDRKTNGLAVAGAMTSWEPEVDHKSLKELEELQVEGEPDIILDLIDGFRRTSQTRLANMHQHLKGRDLESLAREAHNLKSSARTLGALRLSGLCQQLESLKGSTQVEAAQELLVEVESSLWKALHELNAIKMGLKEAS